MKNHSLRFCTISIFLVLFHFKCISCQFEDLDFAELFAPSSKQFYNGEYFGETVCKEANDVCDTPHGTGTYRRKSDGKILYDGQWYNGHMHGTGTQFFDDGSNYTGQFEHSQRQPFGTHRWPNGTVYKGAFVHNKRDRIGKIIYPNGDVRVGYHSLGVWANGTKYIEAEESDPKKGQWVEWYLNQTYYRPWVKISKKVMNHYKGVTVSIECKVHASNPNGRLLREGEPLAVVEESLNGEVLKIVATLPFSDDAFKVYTCQTMDDKGAEISKKLTVRNPFFMESNGQCGEQFVRKKTAGGVVRKVRAIPGDSEGRIVVGRNAYRGQVPWRALISYKHSKEDSVDLIDACGGTIISPWYVLTAAHCLSHPTENRTFHSDEIRVKLGYTTKPKALNGHIAAVKRIFIHHDFDRGRDLHNDIALLVLGDKIQIGKYVNPVCLPYQDLDKKLHNQGESYPLTISGFGQTFNASDLARGWYYPSHLSVARIKYLNLTQCFKPNQELEFKFEGHFCAGPGAVGQLDFRPDSCSGDSGGPATYEDTFNRRHYLIGLVSYGSKVCGSEPGAVYVNVVHYLPWINQVRLADLVAEYEERGSSVPYDKIDSPVFEAMFNFLSREKESIIGEI